MEKEEIVEGFAVDLLEQWVARLLYHSLKDDDMFPSSVRRHLIPRL